MQYSKKSDGFTLIEMMIVVVIVGVLASIALPSYRAYVRQGKIAEATTNLATARIKMEQFFQDNRKFDTYVDASCDPIAPFTTKILDSTKYFTYACASAAGTYSITATGRDAQDMTGYIYSIDQDNAKKSTLPGSAEVACWKNKAGDSC